MNVKTSQWRWSQGYGFRWPYKTLDFILITPKGKMSKWIYNNTQFLKVSTKCVHVLYFDVPLSSRYLNHHDLHVSWNHWKKWGTDKVVQERVMLLDRAWVFYTQHETCVESQTHVSLLLQDSFFMIISLFLFKILFVYRGLD